MIQTITLLPKAPQSTDPSNFRTNADLFVAALNVFDDEINTVISQINTTFSTINSAVITANASALAAQTAANFQGTWSSATAYSAGQSVLYSGKTYFALLAGTNKNPTDTTYWMQVGTDADISALVV